jgi:hypothetical protein
MTSSLRRDRSLDLASAWQGGMIALYPICRLGSCFAKIDSFEIDHTKIRNLLPLLTIEELEIVGGQTPNWLTRFGYDVDWNLYFDDFCVVFEGLGRRFSHPSSKQDNTHQDNQSTDSYLADLQHQLLSQTT